MASYSGLIGRELRREELPAGTFGDLEQQEVLLAKTADRSVLGCMNDMAFRCEHAIGKAGGLARTDLAELNQALRRNIHSARGYCPPIELAARPSSLTVARPGARTIVNGCHRKKHACLRSQK